MMITSISHVGLRCRTKCSSSTVLAWRAGPMPRPQAACCLGLGLFEQVAPRLAGAPSELLPQGQVAPAGAVAAGLEGCRQDLILFTVAGRSLKPAVLANVARVRPRADLVLVVVGACTSCSSRRQPSVLASSVLSIACARESEPTS